MSSKKSFRRRKKKNNTPLVYFVIFLIGTIVVTYLLLQQTKVEKRKKREKVEKPVIYKDLVSKELEVSIEDFLFLNNIDYVKVREKNMSVYIVKEIYDYSFLKKRFYSFIKRKGAVFVEERDGNKFLWNIIKEKKKKFLIRGKIVEKVKKPKKTARVSILIDDMGYETEKFEKLFRKLHVKFGVSIIPFADERDRARESAKRYKKEIWLHVPMEPIKVNGRRMNLKGFLLVSMRSDYIEALSEEYFDLVPEAIGANNHTGSLFTQRKDKLIPFFRVLKRRGKYFIDSRTTPKTVALNTALSMGIPAIKRDVFIDSTSVKGVYENLRHLKLIALREGKALGIGHPDDRTFKALLKIKDIMGDKVELVFPSELIRVK